MKFNFALNGAAFGLCIGGAWTVTLDKPIAWLNIAVWCLVGAYVLFEFVRNMHHDSL